MIYVCACSCVHVWGLFLKATYVIFLAVLEIKNTTMLQKKILMLIVWACAKALGAFSKGILHVEISKGISDREKETFLTNWVKRNL